MKISSNFPFYLASQNFNIGGDKNTTGVENLTRLLEVCTTTSGNSSEVWKTKTLSYQWFWAFFNKI